jgi:hypothetical protein
MSNSSNHDISLDKAREMIAMYRREMDRILREEYRDQDILPYNETFDKEAIRRVIDQDGCTTLRIYYSMDEEKRLHAIVVASDRNNKDIVPGPLSGSLTEPPTGIGIILEEATRCPPDCPTGTPPPPSS